MTDLVTYDWNGKTQYALEDTGQRKQLSAGVAEEIARVTIKPSDAELPLRVIARLYARPVITHIQAGAE